MIRLKKYSIVYNSMLNDSLGVPISINLCSDFANFLVLLGISGTGGVCLTLSMDPVFSTPCSLMETVFPCMLGRRNGL